MGIKRSVVMRGFQKYQILEFYSIFEVKKCQKSKILAIKGHFPGRPNGGDLFDNGFGTSGLSGKIPYCQFLGYISLENP